MHNNYRKNLFKNAYESNGTYSPYFLKLRQKNEVKSKEKEKKFYQNVFPKITSEKVKKNKTKIFSSIKGISISIQTYNNYMVNYQNLMKYPPNNYYSTERLNQFIPYKIINNTNLNKKRDYYSTFNSFDYLYKNKQELTLNSYDSQKILNQKFLLGSKHKEIKDFRKNNFFINDTEVFKYFIEGIFLNDPQSLKSLNIDENKMQSTKFSQSDFAFYSNYLENIFNNENYTDYKKKEYEIPYFHKNVKLHFSLELKSICLSFEEVELNNQKEKEKEKEIENNKDLNDFDKNYDREKGKNTQRIYLPFRYFPLFFLLNYSSFKVFISEIISYDKENNKFSIKVDENLKKIIKKYSEYCQNKLNLYTNENNETVFKDIIFYENEFHYNYIYQWIIYDNLNTSKIKTKCFRLKIIFPLITLKILNYGITFNKFLNKCVSLELIKNNFISWDRYILYNLFMYKNLRNTFKYILKQERNYLSFELTSKFIGPIIDTTIAKKNNFDFFITETLSGKNHYYYFASYKATISSWIHREYDLHDSVSLQLNDTRKIHKLAKHFGLLGIFNKCLFDNKLTKRYYFSFKYIKDINPDNILTIQNDDKNNNNGNIINKKYKQAFKNNGIEYHLIIRECLLCEKIINIFNYCELKYYKIPEDLLQYLLEENNINDNKIASLLINDSNDLLNLEEIEEYKEFIMRKEYLDSSFTNSKASKNRNKRKNNKFSSRSSLKKVESNKNSDSDKNVLIKLKDTYYENKSHKRQRKSCNTIIMRKLSGLNKTSGFMQFKESKKKTIIIGKKSDDDIKNRGISNKNVFHTKNKNVFNEINNINNGNIKKDSDSYLRGIENQSQLELFRIKSESRNKNNIIDIAKLKINLTDTKTK